MSGVNCVHILGRLGQDPEMRYMPDGKAVCNISVATSDEWKDKNTGEKKEKVEWHRIVIFGPQAAACGQYLSKGREVYLQGKLQTRSWEDKQTGQKRYSTEIVANFVQFLGPKQEMQPQPGRPQPPAQGGYQQPQQQGFAQPGYQQNNGYQYPETQPGDNDPPF